MCDIAVFFTGPYDDDPMQELLQHSVIHGFPSPLPDSGPKPVETRPGPSKWIDWSLASTWSQSLSLAHAPTPSSIEGFEDCGRVYWMIQDVCQWYFAVPRVVERVGEERIGKMREESRVRLGRYLKHWGY